MALMAQSTEFQQVDMRDHASVKAIKVVKPALTGFEPAPAHVNPNLPLNDRTDPAAPIGTSTYDLQSNNSCMNRITNHNTGLAAAWTMGLDAAAGWPNRGTGFNSNDGSGWGPPPVARIEAQVRVGWPALCALADGTPVVVTHISDPAVAISQLHVARWHAGSGTWIETDIPSASPGGNLWPRAVAGGADGNTIHAIGITTPTGNGGMQYAGLNGHLLYHRSTDGGTTWDKLDVILPGIDSTRYTSVGADTYNIDADGETVAVAVFDDLGDLILCKSEDNGETWTTHIVRDFPIDKYAVDQGWTAADLTYQDTVGAPAANAILSTDNTGEVLVDRNGMVHCWFGEMYYADDDLTDGNFSFFPLLGAVRYWNESHGNDSTRVVSGLLDSDGNGTFDLQDAASAAIAGNYFQGATSMMSAGVDQFNNIFLTHTALVENYWKEDANPQLQHYHHVYVTASIDGGETWLDNPMDIIAPGLVDDDDLIPAMEAVYPSMARNVDDQIHIVYQLDFEPGTSLGTDSDPAETNFFYHLALDVADLVTSTEEVVTPETFKFGLAPNPTNGIVSVSYELPTSANASVSVRNMVGQEMMHFDQGDQLAGEYNFNLDVSNLANGVYLVSFQADNQITTKKLVVK